MAWWTPPATVSTTAQTRRVLPLTGAHRQAGRAPSSSSAGLGDPGGEFPRRRCGSDPSSPPPCTRARRCRRRRRRGELSSSSIRVEPGRRRRRPAPRPGYAPTSAPATRLHPQAALHGLDDPVLERQGAARPRLRDRHRRCEAMTSPAPLSGRCGTAEQYQTDRPEADGTEWLRTADHGALHHRASPAAEQRR